MGFCVNLIVILRQKEKSNMNRFLAFLLLIALVFSFAACSDSGEIGAYKAKIAELETCSAEKIIR